MSTTLNQKFRLHRFPRFVSREDASPLFGALVHWRENTLSSQGYTSDGDLASSGDELSEGEGSKLTRVPTGRSTWSRWFGRGWSEKQYIIERPTPELHRESPSQPHIQTSLSDPVDVRPNQIYLNG